MSASSCPANHCGYTGTEHGVKVHYARSHDGTLAKTSVCEICGSEYKIRDGKDVSESRYCSMTCKKVSESSHDTVQGWARARTHKCDWCGDWFVSPPAAQSDFCSRKCADTRKSEMGIISGSNSPLWVEEDADRYWMSPSTVERVLNRDERCWMCGLSNDAHKVMVGDRLHIHHVRPRRKCGSREEANQLSNLLLLCSTCHRRLDNFIQQTGV